ncbi:MAG: RidA family protein [Pseudomonadota bacterium]|nr:RidA family protein [Pseudomonadota bacterium]
MNDKPDDRHAIQVAGAPRPVGQYPHARRVGNLLFLSGIGPRDAMSNAVMGNVHDADGHLISYDIDSQTRAVFANVRAVLEASGACWEDLIDVTVYLTSIDHDFQRYNAVWAEYFPDIDTAPCRTTLGITALPTPIAIELKCVAALTG